MATYNTCVVQCTTYDTNSYLYDIQHTKDTNIRKVRTCTPSSWVGGETCRWWRATFPTTSPGTSAQYYYQMLLPNIPTVGAHHYRILPKVHNTSHYGPVHFTVLLPNIPTTSQYYNPITLLSTIPPETPYHAQYTDHLSDIHRCYRIKPRPCYVKAKHIKSSPKRPNLTIESEEWKWWYLNSNHQVGQRVQRWHMGRTLIRQKTSCWPESPAQAPVQVQPGFQLQHCQDQDKVLRGGRWRGQVAK